jgi:hypothetical protein
VFDRDRLYHSLGCEQSLGEDEQLLLFDQVRVQCSSNNVVAILESAVTDQRTLDALFQVSVSYTGCLPFMTRSGHPALRMHSMLDWDETLTALDCLNAIFLELDIMTGQ